MEGKDHFKKVQENIISDGAQSTGSVYAYVVLLSYMAVRGVVRGCCNTAGPPEHRAHTHALGTALDTN